MKSEKGSEIITTICKYENSVAMPDNERLTFLDTCGIARLKHGNGNVKAQEAYANRCSEYLRFGHEVLVLADARENDEDFKSALDLFFVQIEEGKAYSYVAEYDQYLRVPSKYRRNSDGMKPADRKGLVGSEDFALLCWDSVNHLPAIRRISLKASLTSRLIDFKYLREAEAPAYTHGVPNDTFDYEFDDDDDDIPAFSVPEA